MKYLLISFRIFFVLGVSLFTNEKSLAQFNTTTTPYIRNYLPEEFKAYPHNWTIIQDNKEILYVGNRDGILEYDGNTWRLLETPSLTRSFAKDKNGKIYVGLKNDFGYLDTNSKGSTIFVSLKEKLIPKYKEFNDVWKIHIIGEEVYFQTFDEIFILKNGSINIILPQNKFHLSFVVFNKLIIKEWDLGLLELKEGKLRLIPGSEQFANERIYAMLPFKEKQILIGTRTKGIIIYDLISGEFIRLKQFKEISNYITANPIYEGVLLNDNVIAFATLNNGILIFNKKGQLLNNFNAQNGLPGNEIYHIYKNQKGHLWASLSNGITLIKDNSPFTSYSSKNGIRGLISSLIYHKEKLYVATTQSLFIQKNKNQFIPINGIEGQNFHLFEKNNTLLLAHNPGVYEINNNKASLVSGTKNIRTFVLRSIKTQPKYLLAGSDGLLLLEFKNKSWVFKHAIEKFTKPVIELEEDKNGNLWVYTNPYLYKLSLNQSLDKVISEQHFTSKHGLPTDYGKPYKLNNEEIVIGTENGIYAYNQDKNHFEPHPSFKALKGKITAFKQDKNNNIWFEEKVKNDRNEKGVLKLSYDSNSQKKIYKAYKTPFLKFNNQNIISQKAIYPISDSVVYIGTSKGLLSYNSNKQIKYDIPYQTFIRKVYSDNNILFDGNFYKDKKGTAIDYSNNDISFHFASSFYEDSDKSQYSYRLIGRENKWSDWSTEYKKEYTNLHENKYVFEVKSKNIYDIEGSIARFSFCVNPPWYRSIWAYSLYIVFSIIFIWFIVRINTNRLIKEKQKLENIVTKRTSEIQSQKEEIQTQNQILTEQKIALEKSYENLKLLNTIGKDITQSLSITTIVNTVYDKIKSLMEVTEFGISVYDEETQEITYKNYYLRDKIIPEVKVSTKRIDRIGVYSLVYNKEIWLNNVKENYKKYVTSINDYQEGELLNSLICLPLNSGNLKIGTLSVQSEKLNAYTEYHVNLLRNIATYTAAAIENANSYEKILELDQFKESMTGMIVHDLKTPLNNIIGLSTGTPSERRLQSLNQSGLQMLNLVSNILDVYKFENTKITLKKESYPVLRIIESAYHQVEFLIDEKSILIKNEVDSLHSVYVDFHLIERVLINLLTNAVKYTPVTGKITISTKLIGEEKLEIKITDTGQGIPENKIGLVFEKFQQVSAKKSGIAPSTGLGLNFCKMVVEAHGGSINVSSKIGEGASFFFTLPKGKTITNKKSYFNDKSISNFKDFELGPQEKGILKSVLHDLKSQEIYYYSDIEEILIDIDFDQSENLSQWYKYMKKAMLQTSETLYHELLNMISKEEENPRNN